MNNGHIIGSMAVGALLAPLTGGVSLAVALAGVSAGSIITKMGEEWEEDTTTEEETPQVEAQTTRPTTANSGGDVNIAPAGQAFVNGRLVRF